MVRPISALYDSIDRQVYIICKDGTECTGKITEVDEFMNIVLEDSQEFKNNKFKKNEGALLVRGPDISIIRLDWNKVN